MLTIEAERYQSFYWADLWRFRELIYFLCWRDLLVRYKQTTIGVLWGVVRPLLVMLALTLVFGKLVHLDANQNYPYAILVLSGLLPWQFFGNTLTESSESLVGNANLITKIYFPRIIIPICSTVVSLVDFAIAIGVLFCIMLYYQFMPSWHIFALPLFIAHSILFTLGFGLLISSLNVKYRDFRYVIPFIIQFGLYVTPVGYTTAIIPEKWRIIAYLNPIAGIIDGFRWSIIGADQPMYMPGYFFSLFCSFAIFFIGVAYFRNTEAHFAEII
jgi:lipopolysaccharide transport system permease protein